VYKIFGFVYDEVLGRVAEVEFSTPLRGRYAYLLGNFNAFNEGSLRMRREGDRWKVRIRLPEGVWHYAFSIDGKYEIDDENPNVERYFRPSYKFDRLTNVLVVAGDDEAFHRPSLTYLYEALDGVHVLLRCRKGFRRKVYVVVKRMKDGVSKRTMMRKVSSDDLFDYFETVLQGYTGEDLLTYEFQAEDGELISGPFSAHPYRLHHPEWVLGSVFYQVMPSRYGGLDGLAEELDHVSSMGFNAIYLTPIFESTSYHGYDIVDYKEVAKRIGGMEALRVLMKRLKDLNIRLVLDGVFHHTSFFHPYFQDVVRRGRESTYADYYRILGFPVVSKGFLAVLRRDMPREKKTEELRRIGWNYESFFNVWLMPRLNHDQHVVREFVRDILDYWKDVASGWRLDVAHGVPPAFWESVLGDYLSDEYIIGEVMDDPSLYLGKFHGFMNYPLYDAMLRFFVRRDITAGEFLNRLERINVRLGPFRYLTYNFLDNHDTPRFLDLVDDRRRYLCALTFLLTYVGVPSILYGDEVGLRGTGKGGLESSRSHMVWEREKWDEEILRVTKRLILLRRRSDALKRGRFIPLEFKGRFLSYERIDEKEHVRVCINLKRSPRRVEVPRGYEVAYGDLSDGEIAALSSAILLRRHH